MIRFLVVVFSFYLSACSYKPWIHRSEQNRELITPDAEVFHSIYLIGDAGEPQLGQQEPVLQLLRQHLEGDSNSSVIFLGDNIYRRGLPAEGASNREQAEQRLTEQLLILENYKGRPFFVSGNHDWDYMGEGGFAAILRQEQFIEQYLGKRNVFIPGDGCPGPYPVRLSENTILIAIDSQWWLHEHLKPYGNCGDCPARNENDFLIRLEDLLNKYSNEHIVIAAHHPLVSNGNHGGYFNLKDHLFPLTLVRRKLYIPMPLIGSLYPLYRSFGGTAQDIAHYRYQEYVNSLLLSIGDRPNVTFVAGHDHNLQFHRLGNLSHIISGSGSKTDHVRGGRGASFTYKEKGFCRIRYYSNGETHAEYFVPKDNEQKQKMVFGTTLYTLREDIPPLYCTLPAVAYADSMVSTTIVEDAKKIPQNRWLLKNAYHTLWRERVNIPLMDLREQEGGLLPIGRTFDPGLSLRLMNINEENFLFDLTQKIVTDPSASQWMDLRYSQRSRITGQHPFATLSAEYYSSVLQLLHTKSTLRKMPDDDCLGPFREEFGNQTGFFREQATGEHPEKEYLGGAETLIGYTRLLDLLERDYTHQIDTMEYLKSRLLDMLLGDWNRDEDSYRWAGFKKDGRTIFRPVAINREHAFYNSIGIVAWLSHRSWGLAEIENFDKDYRNAWNLNRIANPMDRRLLSFTEWSQWESVLRQIQNQLSDQEIQEGLNTFPEEISSSHKEELFAKLKNRRETLIDVGRRYYLRVVNYVDLYGTDESELFEIHRVDNIRTEVRVTRLDEDLEPAEVISHRIYFTAKTNEIRVYSMGGSDVIQVTGTANRGPILRLIGGNGHDTYYDSSSLGRGAVQIYDLAEGNTIEKGPDTRLRLSYDERVYSPDMVSYFENQRQPYSDMHYNIDDGLFLYLGGTHTSYGFRRNPYKSRHRISVGRAFLTGSNHFSYVGDHRNIVGNNHWGNTVSLFLPYFMNVFQPDGSYQSLFMDHLKAYSYFYRQPYSFLRTGLGVHAEFFHLPEGPPDRISGEPIEETVFHAGLRYFFEVGTRDQNHNPTRGIILRGNAIFNKNLHGLNGFFQRYSSDFTFYISPNIPFQLTLASRTGAAATGGEFEFYQANALGQAENLRGFRRTRFLGANIFYQNTEIRSQVVRFRLAYVPVMAGISAHSDLGRAWGNYAHDTSWHFGYGGGAWLNFYNRIIVSGAYTISEEERLVTMQLGFPF
ncbi:MAG: metallophosphoesterase [Cytophagaceae bacterium]